MILVLARPAPILKLSFACSSVITEVLSQPYCAVVDGVHVEGVVPLVIAASRYVHVSFKSSPHLNGVGAT